MPKTGSKQDAGQDKGIAATAGKPKLVAIDAEGKVTRLKAERLEIDFGDGRKLVLAFPERAWGDLEIEADADDAAAVPMLSLQPGACNLLTLRVDVHHDMSFVDVPGLPEHARPPALRLSVQKAVEGEDKANAPKKNHIRRWAQAALQRDAEVTVRLVGEEEGRELNRAYRGRDYATNVLTFAYADGEDLSLPAQDNSAVLAGDLVLCVPVVMREAALQGKTPEAHFAHLVVHGMLHLQGHDHENEAEAAVMERLETDVLRGLGYADPYA
ncbi:metalloprotease fusion protein [Thauera sp. 28]|uniref:rRNA maturation RNase YbeY n=1 Tax=Thauera sp. 28 TaxID=303682 RepID=UPI0002CED216|nr:rRNA maturation RNase YbeY [Thauera sp. 28]ENO92747.1 metalloprotease fusion protein [Thauera sp. 28]